jgi:hypothetical protein
MYCSYTDEFLSLWKKTAPSATLLSWMLKNATKRKKQKSSKALAIFGDFFRKQPMSKKII